MSMSNKGDRQRMKEIDDKGYIPSRELQEETNLIKLLMASSRCFPPLKLRSNISDFKVVLLHNPSAIIAIPSSPKSLSERSRVWMLVIVKAMEAIMFAACRDKLLSLMLIFKSVSLHTPVSISFRHSTGNLVAERFNSVRWEEERY